MFGADADFCFREIEDRVFEYFFLFNSRQNKMLPSRGATQTKIVEGSFSQSVRAGFFFLDGLL